MAELYANRRIRLNLSKFISNLIFSQISLTILILATPLRLSKAIILKRLLCDSRERDQNKTNFSKRRIIALKFRAREPTAKRSGPSQRVRGSVDHKHQSCRRESILKSLTRLPVFEASNLLYWPRVPCRGTGLSRQISS